MLAQQNTTDINFSLQLLTKMNNYLLELTPLQFRIFITLCQNTANPLTQAEIARQTQATPAGVHKSLQTLDSKDLITQKQGPTPNIQLIELKKTKRTKYLKQVYNLLQINESNLVEKLEETYPGTTIILFGSYNRGEDTIRSDIDIAIIGAQTKHTELTQYEKKLKRNINIQHYKNLKEIHQELKENILNGTVLVGAIHDTGL